MLTTVAVASLLAFGPPSPAAPRCLPGGDGPGDDALRTLYEQGVSFETFLAGADRRAEAWHGNYALAERLDPDLVDRARRVPGTWRFLVVSVAGCSDSVSIIPFLARLVEQVPGLGMRIIDSRAGRAVMEAHRTADGRPATPTAVLLDAEFDEAGCFIERPRSLQEWITENQGTLVTREIYERKMAWYAEDAGGESLEEFVRILEAAGRGEVICQG